MPTSPDQARHELQYRILRTAAPWLSAYYALILVAHAAYLAEPLRARMMAVAGFSAALFGALALGRDQAPLRNHPHSFALVLLLVVLGNSGVHLAATGEAFQVTNLLLTVIGAAVLLTSARLFALTLALAAAAFGTAVWLHPTDPLWPHFGFALFAADALATVAFAIRRATADAQLAAENERDRIELDRQKRAAEAVAHGARYEAVVSLSPAAIVVHREGRVLFANEAAARLIGAGDASVLVDTRLYDLFPPEDETAIASWHAAAIAGNATADRFDSRLRALTGPWPFVELQSAVITWKDQPAAILVATDITDRRNLEQLQARIVDTADRKAQAPLRQALAALDQGDAALAREHLELALRTLDEIDQLAGLTAAPEPTPG